MNCSYIDTFTKILILIDLVNKSKYICQVHTVREMPAESEAHTEVGH